MKRIFKRFAAHATAARRGSNAAIPIFHRIVAHGATY
jgi:hypothetical protein